MRESFSTADGIPTVFPVFAVARPLEDVVVLAHV